MGQQTSQSRSRVRWTKRLKAAGLWAVPGAGAVAAYLLGPPWSALFLVLGAIYIERIRKERALALAKNTKALVTDAMNNPNCAALSVDSDGSGVNYTAKP